MKQDAAIVPLYSRLTSMAIGERMALGTENDARYFLNTAKKLNLNVRVKKLADSGGYVGELLPGPYQPKKGKRKCQTRLVFEAAPVGFKMLFPNQHDMENARQMLYQAGISCVSRINDGPFSVTKTCREETEKSDSMSEATPTPQRISKCPMCGKIFDPGEEDVLICPKCGKEGSTACCMSGGKNCICIDCEETDD